LWWQARPCSYACTTAPLLLSDQLTTGDKDRLCTYGTCCCCCCHVCGMSLLLLLLLLIWLRNSWPGCRCCLQVGVCSCDLG
jgi:hypothetical protein